MIGSDPWLPPLSWTGGGMTIRIYSPNDAKALQQATVESYEHLRPWMPWAKLEQSLAETEAICRRLASEFLANRDFTLGVWEGDTLVGGTGFHLRVGPIEWRCGEIGMWVRQSHAGQGWGTRILEQMLAWGFTDWGWQRLVWKCDTRNVGSYRVAEKCGMIREATFVSSSLDVDGFRQDMYLYAMLREQWTNRS
ncbi:MAG: GNAT family N-acetyltransferase [Armatimonadetes bacterium]|nr:GNAT family N-acetyltransferase [Armatimonadota bacterium]